MTKQYRKAVIEKLKTEIETERIPEPEPEPIKTKRVLSEDALEKLKKARELALIARKKKAEIDAQHREIKETFGQKLNDVETFHKIKEKADEEVKKNEIVNINKKLEDIHTRFNSFLDDREKRKQEKAQRKQEKQAYQIAKELPMNLSKQMLQEELKKVELERMRKHIFGY